MVIFARVRYNGSMDTKTCRTCGQTKLLSSFTRHNGNAYKPDCKPCRAERLRHAGGSKATPRTFDRDVERRRKAAYRAKYPEKAAAQVQRQSARVRLNAAQYLWQKAKERAQRKGVPFTITPADVVVPDVCPALGMPMEFGGGNEGRENSPSLDRINPALGYVPGNVQVLSYRANRIKTDATIAELRAVVAFLDRIVS